MTIGNVTLDTIKSWGRIETDEDDTVIQSLIMPAARARIYEYTGLEPDDADSLDSLGMAYVALCVFLYDNRSLDILSDKQNAVVQGFLDAHRVNLM